MSLEGGDLFVTGDLLSYQQMNRIMQNRRGTSEPASWVVGMLWSQTVTDKLFHEGTAGHEEVLQEARSSDVDVSLKDLTIQGLNVLVYEGEVLTYEGEVLTYGHK